MIAFSYVWQLIAVLISVGCVVLGVMTIGVVTLPTTLALFINAITFAVLVWSGHQLRVTARILRDARRKLADA